MSQIPAEVQQQVTDYFTTSAMEFANAVEESMAKMAVAIKKLEASRVACMQAWEGASGITVCDQAAGHAGPHRRLLADA
ncbi:hypothetical protein [Curtobacterium sp. MCSS17_015]|uniref:hypothetical protein n=1 Tax=Curtobacterium sp. MCSS17_015 TaxID=2175666 RepID=UPI000DA84395|nr:hypothetical protein [Curtobacterium sp. MCSS17_015]WIB25797.1 hypothetical protein DEJ18_12165 [Curtobacterium sp. MCSS17_015]